MTKTLRDLKAAEDEYRTNPDRVYKLHDTIKKLKKREEYIWKQRLRTTWLKKGDQNSRYFHCSANQMKKKKKGILFLVCMMGAVVERYFQSMFTTFNPTGFEEILCGIQPFVKNDMNKATYSGIPS